MLKTKPQILAAALVTAIVAAGGFSTASARQSGGTCNGCLDPDNHAVAAQHQAFGRSRPGLDWTQWSSTICFLDGTVEPCTNRFCCGPDDNGFQACVMTVNSGDCTVKAECQIRCCPGSVAAVNFSHVPGCSQLNWSLACVN